MKKRIFINYFDGVYVLNDAEFVRLFFSFCQFFIQTPDKLKTSSGNVAVACTMIPWQETARLSDRR
jgi:hypothetical protein